MCKLVRTVGLFALLLLFCSSSQAIIVGYEVVSTGGNSWEYTYTIINNEAFDIESISITFNSNECYNLGFSSTLEISGNWDEQFLNYIPGSQIYDALAVGGNRIGMGETVSGFSVSFNYSGSETPGSQFFEIYDPEDYSEPLVSGWTVPVPEPATIMLISLGFACIT